MNEVEKRPLHVAYLLFVSYNRDEITFSYKKGRKKRSVWRGRNEETVSVMDREIDGNFQCAEFLVDVREGEQGENWSKLQLAMTYDAETGGTRSRSLYIYRESWSQGVKLGVGFRGWVTTTSTWRCPPRVHFVDRTLGSQTHAHARTQTLNTRTKNVSYLLIYPAWILIYVRRKN